MIACPFDIPHLLAHFCLAERGAFETGGARMESTHLVTDMLRIGNIRCTCLMSSAPSSEHCAISCRVMFGVIVFEYQLNNFPHANRHPGMGSCTVGGCGTMPRDAALSTRSWTSSNPSKHGHNIKNRNSISSAVMEPQEYFPLSLLARTAFSRPSNARTMEFATKDRSPLCVNLTVSSAKTARTAVGPPCTLAVTAHAGCSALWLQHTFISAFHKCQAHDEIFW